MVIEFTSARKTTEEMIRDEHNAYSGSRKVSPAPIMFVWDDAGSRMLAPIHKATIAGTAVVVNKAIDGLSRDALYRFISSVDVFINQGAVDAVVGDFYIPANTSTIFKVAPESSERLTVISSAVGFFQLQEIRP